MKKKIKNKRGFTLVETALVLFIASFAGFVAFSQILKSQETSKAEFAGSQIKLIGDATNAYISNRYDSLSALKNASGNSIDLGPRTCLTSTSTCTITVQTLINEGF